MTQDQHFDLLILGAGPAGIRAAKKAVVAGMKTAVVEPELIGGTCLNVGCVPTKFLLGGTHLVPTLKAQKRYKVAEGDIHIDFDALQTRKDRFIKGTRDSLEKELMAQGVVFYRGRGSFTGSHSVEVNNAGETASLTFGHCIVATGSIPATFPGLKPDGQCVLSSTDLLGLREVPESLIIVGAGVIGIELGESLHRLGTKIIMVGRMPRILPGEDPETSEFLLKYFQREGWEIHTGQGIASAETVDGRARLLFDNGEEIYASKALIAVGRRPNAEGLGYEHAGIETKPNGFIKTDDYLRCARHIYAIGDINGLTLLAHAGEHQAGYVVAHAAGMTNATYHPPAMPACIYGTMEVMRVGPTELELADKGIEYAVTRSDFAANVIPVSYGHPQGFVKILWSENRLCSILAVGYRASHLVTAAAELVASGIQKNAPLPFIFSHPTLDEAIESAMLSPLRHI